MSPVPPLNLQISLHSSLPLYLYPFLSIPFCMSATIQATFYFCKEVIQYTSRVLFHDHLCSHYFHILISIGFLIPHKAFSNFILQYLISKK